MNNQYQRDPDEDAELSWIAHNRELDAWTELLKTWVEQAFTGEAKPNRVYIANGIWREVIWNPDDEDDFSTIALRPATEQEIQEGNTLMDWLAEILPFGPTEELVTEQDE